MGTNRSCSPNSSPPRQPRRPTDDHWHQSLCSAYLQEYVQYVHSLGFLQLEIKPMTAKTKGPKSALKTPRTPGEMEEQHQRGRRLSMPLRAHGNHSGVGTSHSETNVLYFHKSHQGDDALWHHFQDSFLLSVLPHSWVDFQDFLFFSTLPDWCSTLTDCL